MKYVPNIAVIDSGTSYFYLPQDLFREIQQKYFKDCVYYQGIPVCSCSQTIKWPYISFIFTEVKVFIDPEDYIAEVIPGMCTYLFGSIDGFNQILLGDIFFRNYIVTFDKKNQRIGFSGDLHLPPDKGFSHEIMVGLGWTLMTLAAALAGFGVFILLRIDETISQFADREGLFFPDIELSESLLSRQRSP